ncbi:hypothetical protein H0H93_006853 [Arthromyces matolae]|nr:hypothetical protein H0H93_006853 [Arthromyces matolae]
MNLRIIHPQILISALLIPFALLLVSATPIPPSPAVASGADGNFAPVRTISDTLQDRALAVARLKNKLKNVEWDGSYDKEEVVKTINDLTDCIPQLASPEFPFPKTKLEIRSGIARVKLHLYTWESRQRQSAIEAIEKYEAAAVEKQFPFFSPSEIEESILEIKNHFEPTNDHDRLRQSNRLLWLAEHIARLTLKDEREMREMLQAEYKAVEADIREWPKGTYKGFAEGHLREWDEVNSLVPTTAVTTDV